MNHFSVSLPGAEETEQTTILGELNRNFIEPVVERQTAETDANERVHDSNVDNDQVSDVVGKNQLTECQIDVTDNVNTDSERVIIPADKLCNSDRNDGIEILNFNLQTIEDTDFDDKIDPTELKSEGIGDKTEICDESTLVGSGVVKSDSPSTASSQDNPGKSLREVSPPPVPLVTYRWEDVRRDKKKVRFGEVHIYFA